VTSHILEAKCQKVATEVWNQVVGRCPVTLIAYYGANARSDGTTFVTTLQRAELIATLEVLLARWAGEPSDRDPLVWLPAGKQLVELTDLVRTGLPFSVGSAILFGSGKDMVCATYASRDDVRKAIEGVLLPQLRAQQVVTVQPEAST
jgi:hypothetical protein